VLLSPVRWNLLIVTTVKYRLICMRVYNDGEVAFCFDGLVGSEKQRLPTIVAVGLFGAALLYGDGAITPQFRAVGRWRD